MIFENKNGDGFRLVDEYLNPLGEEDIVRNVFNKDAVIEDFDTEECKPFHLYPYKKNIAGMKMEAVAFVQRGNQGDEVVEVFGAPVYFGLDFGLFAFNCQAECIVKRVAYNKDHLYVNLKDKYFKLKLNLNIKSLGFKQLSCDNGNKLIDIGFKFMFNSSKRSLDHEIVSNVNGASVIHSDRCDYTIIIVDDYTFRLEEAAPVYPVDKEYFDTVLLDNRMVEATEEDKASEGGR